MRSICWTTTSLACIARAGHVTAGIPVWSKTVVVFDGVVAVAFAAELDSCDGIAGIGAGTDAVLDCHAGTMGR